MKGIHDICVRTHLPIAHNDISKAIFRDYVNFAHICNYTPSSSSSFAVPEGLEELLLAATTAKKTQGSSLSLNILQWQITFNKWAQLISRFYEQRTTELAIDRNFIFTEASYVNEEGQCWIVNYNALARQEIATTGGRIRYLGECSSHDPIFL